MKLGVLLLVAIGIATVWAIDLTSDDDFFNYFDQFARNIGFGDGCLQSECPQTALVSSCTSTCGMPDATQFQNMFNTLNQCIVQGACKSQPTTQIGPFNVSLNVGGDVGTCYWSSDAPKLQLVPKDHTAVLNTTGEQPFSYTTTSVMDLVWSNMNIQCPKSSSSSANSQMSPCFREIIKSLSFLCPIKKLLPVFSFYFLFWLPCPTAVTDNGPFQFTQTYTINHYYYFKQSSGELTLINSPGNSDDLKYNFDYMNSVPANFQAPISTAIQNLFTYDAEAHGKINIHQIPFGIYYTLLDAFISGYCTIANSC